MRNRYTNCLWKELVATSATQSWQPSKRVAKACIWKLNKTWIKWSSPRTVLQTVTEWSSKSNQSSNRKNHPVLCLQTLSAESSHEKMTCLLSGSLLIYPDSSKCLSVLSIRETRCLSHRERQQSQELCTPAFCLQYVLGGQRSDVSLGAVYHEDGLWDQGWRVKGGGEPPPERPLGSQWVACRLDHGEEPSSLYLKDIKSWVPRQHRERPESPSLIPSVNYLAKT